MNQRLNLSQRLNPGKKWSALLIVAALALAACGNSEGAEGTPSTSTTGNAAAEVYGASRPSSSARDAKLLSMPKTASPKGLFLVSTN